MSNRSNKKNKYSFTTENLVVSLNRGHGRSRGRVTVRHKSAGAKKQYRVVDFERSLKDVKGRVKGVEYDPNRNLKLALIQYENGLKSFILLPKGLKIGDIVESGENASVKPGSSLPINKVPIGTIIHNIEIEPGKGAKLSRSAGTSCTLLGFDEKYAIIKLPSKETRLINKCCFVTIGELSNSDFKNRKLKKAGTKRHLGIRPTVRGMVMSPSAHPHGGGEAKGSIGHVAKDVYGNIRDKKTKRRKNRFKKFIITTRKGGKVV